MFKLAAARRRLMQLKKGVKLLRIGVLTQRKVERDVVVIVFSKINHIRLVNSSSQITTSAVKTSYLAEGIW